MGSSSTNPSSETLLKVGIVGFGPFAQFLSRTILKQGHLVSATSRSDHSQICSELGITFYRYLHTYKYSLHTLPAFSHLPTSLSWHVSQGNGPILQCKQWCDTFMPFHFIIVKCHGITSIQSIGEGHSLCWCFVSKRTPKRSSLECMLLQPISGNSILGSSFVVVFLSSFIWVILWRCCLRNVMCFALTQCLGLRVERMVGVGCLWCLIKSG